MTETQESSAACGALFKEDMPKKVVLSDMFMNMNKTPEEAAKEKKSDIDIAEDDTLMGRLAKRMAARDFIDRFNLGTKSGKTAKAITTADNGPPQKVRIEGPAKALETGKKIEKEHDGSVKKLVEGKASPKDAPELIAKDHLREHAQYYDKKEGLPAMEKKLSNMADQARAAGNVFGETPEIETFK